MKITSGKKNPRARERSVFENWQGLEHEHTQLGWANIPHCAHNLQRPLHAQKGASVLYFFIISIIGIKRRMQLLIVAKSNFLLFAKCLQKYSFIQSLQNWQYDPKICFDQKIWK
jgi:hypothetical protein